MPSRSAGARLSDQSARVTSLRATALVRALVVVAVVLVGDRITKHAVKHDIAPGHVVKVVPGLTLVHDQNNGVAFGVLAGGGALVVLVTAIALAALVVFFITRSDRRWLWLSTGLVVGGAIGNLLDRLVNGSVTDFIKLPHWPAFNVSDIAITIGVLSLVWVLEGRRARDGR